MNTVQESGNKDMAPLGAGALVFVGGMAMVAASFLVEQYVIKSLKRS